MSLDVAKRWLQHKCKRVIKYPHTLKTNLWQIALDVVKSLLQHKCQRTIKYLHIDIENWLNALDAVKCFNNISITESLNIYTYIKI